jgi:Ala-tRNA(Pro) deacylase
MPIPGKLESYLNENGVRFERLQHPERFTAQEAAEVEGVSGQNHAKVVIVNAGGDLAMTVMPSHYRIDLEKLEAVMGRTVSLASEDEFKSRFPDCEPGTMPPFGNLYDLATYVDGTLIRDEFIVFEAGTHRDAVRMSYRDFERLVHPTVADFAIKFHPVKVL